MLGIGVGDSRWSIVAILPLTGCGLLLQAPADSNATMDGGIDASIGECETTLDCPAPPECGPTLVCHRNRCVPGPELACADGVDCTDDRCEAGRCVHEPKDAMCGTPPNDCVRLVCDPVLDCQVRTRCRPTMGECVNEVCNGAMCIPQANHALCEARYGEGATCNEATMMCEGDCEMRPDCDPLDECHGPGVCRAGRCADYPIINVGGSCDDHNACTDASVCTPMGDCLPPPTAAPPCDTGNPCTTRDCAPDTGCGPERYLDGNPCDDGDRCTGPGVCASGSCEPGEPVVCPVPPTGCFAPTCSATSGCGLVPICDPLTQVCIGNTCECAPGWDNCDGDTTCECAGSCDSGGLGCSSVLCPVNGAPCGDDCCLDTEFCNIVPGGAATCAPIVGCDGSPDCGAAASCCPCTGMCCADADLGCCPPSCPPDPPMTL